VNEEISSQNAFLKAKRQSQLTFMEKQSQMLSDQEGHFEASKQSHVSLCQEVFENVMKGVKTLVSEQLKVVIADNEVCTEKLLSTNHQLLSSNEELKVECGKIYDNLDYTNARLLDEGCTMKATDESVLEKLKEGHGIFSDLHNFAIDSSSKQEAMAATAGETVGALESIDMRLGELRETLSADAKLHLEHIKNNVHGAANESISRLACSGTNALALSRDEIIPKVTLQIAEIEEPREQVLKDASNNLNTILERTQGGVEKLNKATKKQLKATKQTHDRVEEIGKDFRVKICGLHRCQNDKTFHDTITMLQQNEDSVKKLLSLCEQNIVDSNKETLSFGRHVIEMDAPVPITPERQEMEYSESLTSTPEENTIFQNCSLRSLGSNNGETNPITCLSISVS